MGLLWGKGVFGLRGSYSGLLGEQRRATLNRTELLSWPAALSGVRIQPGPNKDIKWVWCCRTAATCCTGQNTQRRRDKERDTATECVCTKLTKENIKCYSLLVSESHMLKSLPIFTGFYSCQLNNWNASVLHLSDDQASGRSHWDYSTILCINNNMSYGPQKTCI